MRKFILLVKNDFWLYSIKRFYVVGYSTVAPSIFTLVVFVPSIPTPIDDLLIMT
jgi:hypothetical protein